MQQMLIYKYCSELRPFIVFDANLVNGDKISCVGHEYHCCDSKCDCYLTNIMIHESGTGARLTQIIYGWRNYDYYKKERFCKTDIDGFINGDLSFLEPRNEQSRAILSGFKSWLSIDKEQKVALFTARYKQFKVAAKDKDHNEDNEWKAFFESMHEVAKAGKLEEFISRSKIK